MLTTFEGIAKNISLKPKLKTIDNVIFKLHYRITFLVMVVATILVCSQQYIGEHIRCISDIKGDVSMKMIETYCFFSSTFTVVRHLEGQDGSTRLHPGVGPWSEQEDVLRHAYYQWVPFVLFFQAIMFYIPHYLWRKLDGGTLFKMAQALHNYTLVAEESAVDVNDVHISTRQEREARIAEVRVAFVQRLPFLNSWARKLVLCECLNMANVVAQFFITNAFLAGRFMDLGPALIRGGDDTDPLDQVFPKMTKCIFRKFGPSGTIQNYDALCVMALNIINEKIYAFLWFWFVALAIATALALVWRLLTILLHRRNLGFNVYVFRGSIPGSIDTIGLSIICGKLSYSQWLFLFYLGKNMDGFVFKRLLAVISEYIQETSQGFSPTIVLQSDEEDDDDNPKYARVKKDEKEQKDLLA